MNFSFWSDVNGKDEHLHDILEFRPRQPHTSGEAKQGADELMALVEWSLGNEPRLLSAARLLYLNCLKKLSSLLEWRNP